MVLRVTLLLVLASFPLRGEDREKELGSLTATLISEREAEFVPERSSETETRVVQLWRLGTDLDGAKHGPYVEIRMIRYESADAAERVIAATRDGTAALTASPDGPARLLFRKGNVTVTVTTCGGRELAERFGFHVVDAIEQRERLVEE